MSQPSAGLGGIQCQGSNTGRYLLAVHEMCMPIPVYEIYNPVTTAFCVQHMALLMGKCLYDKYERKKGLFTVNLPSAPKQDGKQHHDGNLDSVPTQP